MFTAAHCLSNDCPFTVETRFPWIQPVNNQMRGRAEGGQVEVDLGLRLV